MLRREGSRNEAQKTTPESINKTDQIVLEHTPATSESIKEAVAFYQAELNATVASIETQESRQTFNILFLQSVEYQQNLIKMNPVIPNFLLAELDTFIVSPKLNPAVLADLDQFIKTENHLAQLEKDLDLQTYLAKSEIRTLPKEISNDLQKQLELFDTVTSKTWYENMQMRVPYVGKVTGFVTNILSSTAGHTTRKVLEIALSTGTGGSPLLVKMAMSGGISLVMNVIQNYPALVSGNEKWKTAKQVGLNVIGTVAGDFIGTFVGSFAPESAKSLVGSYVTGWLSGIGKVHPQTAKQGQVIEANNFLQTVLEVQKKKIQELPEHERKEAQTKFEKQLLDELNKNKQSILSSTCAKVMAATVATATIGTAIATGTAAPVINGLLWSYKNDIPIINPLIEQGVVSGIKQGIQLTGVNIDQINQTIATKIVDRTNELTKAVAGIDLKQSHVTPEFMRTFIREKIGSTVLEELTFAQLFQHSISTGINVGVQKSMGQMVAATRKWNSIEEAQQDIVTFAGAAQKAMNEIATKAKDVVIDVSVAVQQVYSEGLYALSDTAKATEKAQILETAAAEMTQVSTKTRSADDIKMAAELVEKAKIAREQAKKLNERDLRFAQKTSGSLKSMQELEKRTQLINASHESLEKEALATKQQERQLRRAEVREKAKEIRNQIAAETEKILSDFEIESGIKLTDLQKLEQYRLIQAQFRKEHPEISKAFSKDGILHGLEFEGLGYVAATAVTGSYIKGISKIADVVSTYDTAQKGLSLGSAAFKVGAATAKAAEIVTSESKYGDVAEGLLAAQSILPTLPTLGDITKKSGIAETVLEYNKMRYAKLDEWDAIRGLGYLGYKEQAAVASEVLLGDGITGWLRDWF